VPEKSLKPERFPACSSLPANKTKKYCCHYTGFKMTSVIINHRYKVPLAESAAVMDMFCSLNLIKNHQSADYPATT